MATKREKDRAVKNLDAAREAFEAATAAAAAAGIETAPIAAPAVHIENNTSRTVWVACKLPKGLLLQLHQKQTMDVQVMGGGVKSRDIYARVGDTVRLKGYGVPFGKVPNYPIIGDFGLTEVDRDFWCQWLEQNKSLELVNKKLVYALDGEPNITAWSREHAEIKCGLEPLNPDGDVRVEKMQTPNLTDIETDSDNKHQAA